MIRAVIFDCFGVLTTDFSGSGVNQALLTYIRDTLKPQYAIGMLSNIGFDWPRDNFTQHQYELFDSMALSYQTGQTKPAAVAYETIATRLDMLPEECLFIDDIEQFCTAARETGMQAIHYQSNEQLFAALSEYIDA